MIAVSPFPRLSLEGADRDSRTDGFSRLKEMNGKKGESTTKAPFHRHEALGSPCYGMQNGEIRSHPPIPVESGPETPAPENPAAVRDRGPDGDERVYGQGQ